MICPYCGREAEYLSSKEFYGRSYGTYLYVCRPCDARVGTHKNSDRPLGTLADRELRSLRRLCHAHFDVLWKSRQMTRSQAYKWLQRVMSLPRDKAHIGMFDKEQCRELLDYLGIVSLVKIEHDTNRLLKEELGYGK